jgi:hypothetical protein
VHASTDRSRPDVTTDPTAPLRSRRCASGYRGVYRCHHRDHLTGRHVWVARVKRGGTLRTLPGTRSTDPRQCAKAVAAWYAAEFGPDWPAALAARKVNPFSVRYSAKHRGHVAAVWVCGRREEVVVLRRRKRDRHVPTEELEAFGSAQAAREGVRRYLTLRYGLLAGVIAWRAERAEAGPRRPKTAPPAPAPEPPRPAWLWSAAPADGRAA